MPNRYTQASPIKAVFNGPKSGLDTLVRGTIKSSMRVRINSVPRKDATAAPTIHNTTTAKCSLYSLNAYESTRFSRGIGSADGPCPGGIFMPFGGFFCLFCAISAAPLLLMSVMLYAVHRARQNRRRPWFEFHRFPDIQHWLQAMLRGYQSR